MKYVVQGPKEVEKPSNWGLGAGPQTRASHGNACGCCPQSPDNSVLPRASDEVQLPLSKTVHPQPFSLADCSVLFRSGVYQFPVD